MGELSGKLMQLSTRMLRYSVQARSAGDDDLAKELIKESQDTLELANDALTLEFSAGMDALALKFVAGK